MNVEPPRAFPSYAEALRVWFRIGCLSFGGPAGQIALMHREVVDERRWVSDARFLHALNFCTLLPGPEAQQLATYLGWLLHGVKGGLAAGLLFVLPGALVMGALSAVFIAFGAVPLVAALFFGLQCAVLVLVVEALLRVAKRALHGGVAWAPYRDRLAPFLPQGCATREVYPASEGFVAIADRGDGEGLRLNLDRGCFFEFVPAGELGAPAPRRHWVATVETGVDYAVAVTSCAGLWSYLLGDTVRFVDRSPPRLLVTGRTAYGLSAFGEHLTGEEIEAALLRAAAAEGVLVAEYTVGPVFEGARGGHRWLVEAAVPADAGAAEALAESLDLALRSANDDYAAHRQGAQLAPPDVVLLPPGAFAAWMRSQGKLGGQHKVPRVVADPDRFAAAEAALRGGNGT